MKSKTTCLDGEHWYRSGLEAYWGSVFTALGMSFDYEPATFRLPNNTIYVPDYWMPGIKRFIEIKPFLPRQGEIRKARSLVTKTGNPLFFFCGMPRIRGFDLCNVTRRASLGLTIHWSDGHILGPGMPLAFGLMYALSMAETEECRQALVIACQHARALLIRERTRMKRLGEVMSEDIKLPWPTQNA